MQVFGMPGHIIRRLNQLATTVFAEKMLGAGMDLTPVQFAALDAIIAHPGLDQASIAAKIAYDRATIGGVIERLEKKGLVERQISQKDRRARVINITQCGRDVYDCALPFVTELQNDILSGLDTAEQQDFLRLSNKIIRHAAKD